MNMPSVTNTFRRGHGDATGLGQLAGGHLDRLVLLHLQQHGRRELASLEALLEGEHAVLGQLEHVELAVVGLNAMSWMAVKPSRYTVHSGPGSFTEHNAPSASGSIRHTWEVPGRNGKPFSSPT